VTTEPTPGVVRLTKEGLSWAGVARCSRPPGLLPLRAREDSIREEATPSLHPTPVALEFTGPRQCGQTRVVDVQLSRIFSSLFDIYRRPSIHRSDIA
jgi:hypothetical protein